MKKVIIPLIIIIAFVLAMPVDSMARKGHGYYKHGRGHHHRHHNRHHHKYRPYSGGNFFYGSYSYYPRPNIYYAPPPVVYAPPPVYYGPSYYPPSGGYLNFGIVLD